MNWPSILISGFGATIILTGMIIGGQSLGLTRIDMPFIVGTMLSSDRDRAKFVGLVMHLVNGWAFAIVYAVFFQSVHIATWWFGALLGCVQGLFVVVAVLPLLPGIHPRMVSDFRGPQPTRLLEPPGFLATNYGRTTPLVVVLSHTVYGLVIGLFYVLR